MNTSIGPLTFHKEDLLCFLPVFCFQWLQQAAHSNTWRWSSTSLVPKTAPGNECGQNCQRLVFLALHHLLTHQALCFVMCSHLSQRQNMYSHFFHYRNAIPCGLQHNPCSNLMSLKRTSYLLIAKDNNCIAGQRGKGEWKDKP